MIVGISRKVTTIHYLLHLFCHFNHFSSPKCFYIYFLFIGLLFFFNYLGKCHCVRSIIWEFKRLDFDGDKHITKSELSKIENNQMEPCVEPFMESCDRNHDSKLTRHEWCCCFAAVRKCWKHCFILKIIKLYSKT